VLGLEGQVDGDVLVVENEAMLDEAIGAGRIDFSKPIEVFSQTTKSPSGYAAICSRLLERMARPEELRVHDTICRQVASRHAQLADFARRHDVIIFVSGRQSSNGKVLFDLCRGANGRTWQIGSPDELRAEWFRDGDRVGVCGATSTPKWLLEDVAQKILQEK
jgi:4-hydroxy-3-methylbut-2-enyl diphosphate reductase